MAVNQEGAAQDSPKAQAIDRMAVVALQNGDYPEAIRLLRESVALDDQNPGSFNNLGWVLNAAGDAVGAEESYRRAIELDPDNPDLLNNLGIALSGMDRLEEAKAVYEEALIFQWKDPEIFHNYGVLLQEMGILDQAQEAYGKALGLNPYREATVLSLGSVYREMGDQDTAIGAYNKAIDLNPLYVDAHEALKLILWDSGERAQMDDSYFRACQVFPKSSEAHSNLGRALVFSQRIEEAERALKKSLELDPQNAEAHNQLGQVYAKQERFKEAVAEHQEAIRFAGGNALYYEEFGNTLTLAGEYREAVDVLLKGHELNPRGSNILGALTIAMKETGDNRVSFFLNNEFVTTRFIEVPDGFDSLDDFNDALHKEHKARHVDEPHWGGFSWPPGQTQHGGTQIPGNVFANPSGMTAILKQQISKAMTEYLGGLKQDPDHPFLRYLNPDFRFTGAFSNIIHPSGYDGSHVHPEGWISGVYWVKMPDLPEESWDAGEGCTQFGEPPKHLISDRNKRELLVRPQAGMTAFFPSYYWHGVLPFGGNDTRHAVAFDII
ncbi:MAG: tetratricopeptide repeat protein [Proteobacteria bacterium]|nr:tetratricopeptide repeat protein [Pseudomonadota bacterium]